MSYIAYCRKTSLEYQVILKSLAIKNCHISYRKFVLKAVKKIK